MENLGKVDQEGKAEPRPGEHPLLGYFDSAEQTDPTFDPGPNVPCVVCYKPLCAPLKTISLMRPGSGRSYFYRAHKACYEGLQPDEIGDLEWSMLNPPPHKDECSSLSLGGACDCKEPRPGGLRSIEQAAREYVEAHRKAGAVRFGAGSAEDAFDADATEDAAWTNLCVAVDGWTPDSQAPTAQSAPPPAGPMRIRNAIVCIPSKYRSVQEWEASLPPELQGVVTFHATGPDGEGYAAPPVEPPAPRPMVLGCAHGRQPGQPCPHCMRISREPFGAPEAQAGEAP